MKQVKNYWEINQATSKCQNDFWIKHAERVLNRKSEHHYKILHLGISLAAKFCLKLTLVNFCIKLKQKGYFQTKENENYNQTLHIPVNLDSQFQLQ